MKLLLVRHGEYIQDSKGIDILNDVGKRHVRKMAHFLQHQHFSIPAIWHSPKNRAAETARIFHDELDSPAEIKVFQHLKPEDPIDPFCDELLSMTENIMAVGHLPFIPRLVSRLLTSGTGPPLLTLPAAGLVILENDCGLNWSLAGFFHPGNV